MMAEVLILQETLVKSFLLMQKNNLRSQHIKQKKKKKNYRSMCFRVKFHMYLEPRPKQCFL